MKIKNIHEKIFLQIGKDTEEEADFNDLSEVTWNKDRINSTDIEYVMKQSPLINAYEHAPMAFEPVIIKANATFLYEGIGVGYKLPGKNTFMVNGTHHLSYDKDFKVFWMPIPK